MRSTSYDKRVVRFEEIHDVKAADLLEFVQCGEPREANTILDLGCGYGAVSTALINFVCTMKPNLRNLYIDLVDESSVQLERARAEVEPVAHTSREVAFSTSYFQGTFPDDFSEWSERYDVIYAKQVLHESPRDAQDQLVKAMFRALRPGGRLVLWEIALDPDPEVGDLFRRAIQEKDRLAGFETLQTNRHFLERTDLLSKLHDNGGAFPSVLRVIPYRFRSRSRLEAELRSDKSALQSLNTYIVQEYERVPGEKRGALNFARTDMSVEFDVPVVIASAVKPSRITSTTLSLFSGTSFERPETADLEGHVIESALAHELGSGLLKEMGPCLLRFSLVRWNKRRNFELISSGLDFVLHFGDNWRQPAESYLAYLASLFERAGGNPERSFGASATGFVAQWFASCSSAAVGHFELNGDLIRLAAFAIPECVVGETTIVLPKNWSSALKAYHSHIKAAHVPASRAFGESGVRISGDALAGTADDLARRVALEVPDGNRLLDALARFMHHSPSGLPAPDLILRLASYLRLADCKHAYYLLPPSVLFKKVRGFPSGAPARFETGNLHITTQEAIDPRLIVELLHWQGAVWQSLTSVEVLRSLIRAQQNS